MPLDPGIAKLFEAIAAAGRPAIADCTPQQARDTVAQGRAALGQGPEMRERRDLTIPTRYGRIPARLLLPDGTPTALVIYLHGGGWVLGALDDYEIFGRALAHRAQVAVLMPDYRLAPEHRFPAGVHDAQDAIDWVVAHAAELCPDAGAGGLPIILAGDSAGANLAAVAAAEGTAKGRIKGLLLVYPVADCDFDTPSYRDNGAMGQPTRADMIWFFDHYADKAQFTDPRISVLRHDGLANLPPTVVVTSEYDPLCHEGDALAERLKSGPVQVTHRCEAGLTHGFIRLYNLVPATDVAVDRLAADVRALAAGRA